MIPILEFLTALFVARSVPGATASAELANDAATGEPGKFAAEEIRRETATQGLALDGSANATRIALTVEQDGQAAPQSYRIRVQNEGGHRTITVRAADEAGAMYGGPDIAEAIRLGTLDSLQDSDHQPHIERRGIKFNIPLDLRKPSYSCCSDAAQANIPEMWERAFWTLSETTQGCLISASNTRWRMYSKTTPLEIAEALDEAVAATMASLDALRKAAKEDSELRKTVTDCEALAWLGRYHASKTGSRTA